MIEITTLCSVLYYNFLTEDRRFELTKKHSLCMEISVIGTLKFMMYGRCGPNTFQQTKQLNIPTLYLKT